ncbi:MAG: hypothetical protein IK076_04865 [Bacteroidales bacterium]|nr:hypothetical protein [Bacteroidales bacterium]
MRPFFPLSVCLLLLSLVSFSCSSRKDVPDEPAVITQVPFEYFNDSTAQAYLSDLSKSGVSVVLISLVDFFQTGSEREAMMERLHEGIVRFEEAGFEVGVWTNSLGYGYERPVLDPLGLTMLTSFDGRTGGAVCATDSVFLDLMRRNVQDFAKAGARFILIDDDLVQSVRPGFTCVCDNHLALLEKATGRSFTREQVRVLFTGAPSSERTAFMDVMGESMSEFCRSLREAVDEIDPGIELSICSSYTHFDAEGVDMDELSRLLAGEGHTPFLRLTGATYWPIVAPRFPGETLGDVADFVRMQVGWYRDRGIILFDENDPYPRDSDIVPASWCEIYDKIMIANGGVNRHKYMFCFSPQDPDRAYEEAHLANMEDDNVLLDLFRGTVPCGYRVWNAEHLLRDVNLPESYAGDNAMMVLASHSAASVFLGANCIPACYEGTGAPGIVFGDQARLLPAEAMGNGLVLDLPAARALSGRGIDVGELPEADGSFLLNHTKDGIFAIFGWDGYDFLTKEERPWKGEAIAEQLGSIFQTMTGGQPLPASVEGQENLYVLAAMSPSGDRLSILLCNLGKEDATDVQIKVPEDWKVSRALRGEVSQKGSALLVSRIPGEQWCALGLKKQ